MAQRTNRKKNVTLKEVAEYAGVSVMTVSNVVNDWPYVSDEMRLKVQEAIDALGYRPSALARSLVTGRSRTVGVVLPDISNPFFGQAIRGCEDVLTEQGYSFFLCNTDEDPQKEKAALETLISRGVDALIIWGSRSECDELYKLIGNDLPVVAIDSPAPQLCMNSTYIYADNIQGAETATLHLIHHGRKTVGHLAGPSQRRLTAQQRLAGYKQALENSAIPYNADFVMEGKPSIRGGYQAALHLLQKHRPAALFCYNDLMAIGAIVAIQQSGLEVPDDIAIVGFDDIFTASLVVPPLTTVRIQQYDLGKLSSNLLLERLQKGGMPPNAVNFPVELVVRDSCGATRLSKEQKQEMMENLVTSLAVDLPNDTDTNE